MKLIKRIIKIIFILIIIALILLGTYIMNQKNEIQKEIDSGLIAKKVRELRSKESFTKFDDIAPNYLAAVIAVEDHRFYEHGAIDTTSVFRAIRTNIENKKLVEGGSTITQQLVKNIFLDQKQTAKRKIREALLAVEMEKRYSKSEILEMYVNNSYFGSGYYNIKDAAKGYYNKLPKDLNLNESAVLAGLPNAPSVYDPRKNYDLAVKRRNIVLSKMVEYKSLKQKQADEVIKMELNVLGADKKDDRKKDKDKDKEDKKSKEKKDKE